jgi:hypothetical protein
MSSESERPDPDLPQDPAIPGTKHPDEVPPDSGPVEPPRPDRSDEDEAAIEQPDQEGQRRLGRDTNGD